MEDKIIVKIDPDLEDLIPTFLQNRHNDIDSMRTALTEDIFDTIRIIGHSMKGAGGGYGFDPITEIGGEIEEAALAKDKNVIEAGVVKLVDYLARIVVSFD